MSLAAITATHAVELLVTIIGVMLGVVLIAGTGWIVIKTGAAKGWQASAEGWEARAMELTRVIDEKDKTAGANADRHHTELHDLRADLTASRERIAVLESQTDLTPLREAIEAHNGEALQRHEAILHAFEVIADRLEHHS